MPANQTREGLIAIAGPKRGRGQEISYRAGLVLQVLGAVLLAVLYPLENPFYTVGIMLFELGALLSAIYFNWSGAVKYLIVGCVVAGLIVQVMGYFWVSEQYAGLVLIAGIGFVCSGAAGIAAKEASLFGYREGFFLAVVVFPVIVFINLFAREDVIINSLIFSILFLLLLSLTGKKLKQPMMVPDNNRRQNTDDR